MLSIDTLPGNTTNIFSSLGKTRTTLRIVRHTVFLLRFSVSPAECMQVPVAKKHNAMQTPCVAVNARASSCGISNVRIHELAYVTYSLS